MKNISQATARTLRKQVASLKDTLSSYKKYWTSDYPGVLIATCNADLKTTTSITTSRKLGKAVCVQVNAKDELLFFATPLDEAT